MAEEKNQARKKPSAFTTVGLIFLLAGSLLLGYYAWAYVGTSVVAKRDHASTAKDLRQEWQPAAGQKASSKALPNGAFALVRIPRFGKEYEVPVVRGTGSSALSKGIGWATNSATPGSIGNTVFAAHRVTHGEPFRNFPRLQRGDRVIVETATATYTYELNEGGRATVVQASESWVTDPVPGEALTVEPKKPLLTLITCTDLYSSERRSIVTADLIKTVNK